MRTSLSAPGRSAFATRTSTGSLQPTAGRPKLRGRDLALRLIILFFLLAQLALVATLGAQTVPVLLGH